MKRENYHSCKPSFIMTTAFTFVFMVLSFCSCHKDKHFYFNNTSGTTKNVEEVPSLGVENEAGTIDLFDYIKK